MHDTQVHDEEALRLVGSDPYLTFERWYADAERVCGSSANEMSLATASAAGRPSVRMVLLHARDTRGLVFFTNYESRKSSELEENPFASVLLYWPALYRQIRIEGSTERIERAESQAYFATRPPARRAAAWASPQSRPIPNRGFLDTRVREVLEDRARLDACPPFWGGYRLLPSRYEFWIGSTDRLHDRWQFDRAAPSDPWTCARLGP